MLNLTSDMVFFSWRMSHIRIHLVFQLQFFISSISCLKCIKLATQSCSSELDRYFIYLVLVFGKIISWCMAFIHEVVRGRYKDMNS
jgi:hypothetical protein